MKYGQLITPAIVIGALAYIVRLFGKVITDSKPFSDDRDWEIELSGLMFFVNFVLTPGIIGYVMARYVGSLWAGHWIHFFTVSILGGWALIATILLLEGKHGIKPPEVGVFKTMKEDPLMAKIVRTVAKWNVVMPQWILSIIYVYVGILEYPSGNILLSLRVYQKTVL